MTDLVQEPTRVIGSVFTFLHIAVTGLTDVQLTIFNSSNGIVLFQQEMAEISNTGVYSFNWSTPAIGTYVGVMSSLTASTKSVAEVNVVTAPVAANGPVVISNNVGVGTQGSC